MFYNAIIRDREQFHSPSKGVVGRLFLKDLQQVPPAWRIRYRGINLEKNSSLDALMCNPQDPIQIFKPTPGGTGPTSITVKTVTGKTFLVITELEETVSALKRRIEEREGIPPEQQRLIFEGQQLQDCVTLMEYKLGDCTIHLVMRLRGGGGPPACFSSADLEGKQQSGRGVPALYSWNGYTIGLNLCGVCPRKTCISNTSCNVSKEIIVKAKYGVVRMTGEKNKFKCPACEETAPKKRSRGHNAADDLETAESKVGRFTPKNFLVSYGRSLFRFKNAGLRQPVKTVLMESVGPMDEFKTFDESEGKSDYDFIEVITVGKNSSPYFCVKCNIPCDAPHNSSRDSEVILDCGHCYHRKCAPTGEEDCFVCETKVLDSIKDLFWAIEESEEEKADSKVKMQMKREIAGNENDGLASLEIWYDEYVRNMHTHK